MIVEKEKLIRNRSSHFLLGRKRFDNEIGNDWYDLVTRKKNLLNFQIFMSQSFRKNQTLKTIRKMNSRQFEKIISNIDGHSSKARNQGFSENSRHF